MYIVLDVINYINCKDRVTLSLRGHKTHLDRYLYTRNEPLNLDPVGFLIVQNSLCYVVLPKDNNTECSKKVVNSTGEMWELHQNFRHPKWFA